MIALILAMMMAAQQNSHNILNCDTWETCHAPDMVFEEPMDVPAITIPAKSWLVSEPDCENYICSDGPLSCSNHGTMTGSSPNLFRLECKDGYSYTCADKSRILLTDESGGKHCVKFPK